MTTIYVHIVNLQSIFIILFDFISLVCFFNNLPDLLANLAYGQSVVPRSTEKEGIELCT